MKSTSDIDHRGRRSPLMAALVVATFIALFYNGAARLEAAPAPAGAPVIGPNIPTTPPHDKPVVLPTPEALPPDVPSTPLTVDEAVRIALVHQANLSIFSANALAAHGHTQQVRAALQPNVVVSAIGTDVISSSGANNIPILPLTSVPVTNGGTGVVATTINGYTMTAEARQLLWDFNYTRNLVRQAAALERSSLATLEASKQDLVLSVKQSYFTYAQNVELAAVQEENLKNQQAHLEIADARYQAGSGIPSDVPLAQTAVANAQFAVNQAQNTVSNSRVSLALLLGIDPRTPIEIAPETPTAGADTEDPNQLVRDALAQRPEMVAAAAALQASTYGVSSARTNNAPNLSAVTDYIQQGDRLTNLNSNIFSIGLQLTWPVFDGGYTAGGIKIAKANEEIARAQLTIARQTVISDVTQAYYNLKTAERQFDVMVAGVKSAEESVHLMSERYKFGLSTVIDLLNAQQALVEARVNQVAAHTALNQARAALDHAVGKSHV